MEILRNSNQKRKKGLILAKIMKKYRKLLKKRTKNDIILNKWAYYYFIRNSLS